MTISDYYLCILFIQSCLHSSWTSLYVIKKHLLKIKNEQLSEHFGDPDSYIWIKAQIQVFLSITFLTKFLRSFNKHARYLLIDFHKGLLSSWKKLPGLRENPKQRNLFFPFLCVVHAYRIRIQNIWATACKVQEIFLKMAHLNTLGFSLSYYVFLVGRGKGYMYLCEKTSCLATVLEYFRGQWFIT